MTKSKCKLTINGQQDILKDIEKMGGSIPEVIIKAVEKSGDIATEEYKRVIEKHRYSGLTEETIVKNPKAINDGQKITLNTGFDIAEGGLASIFLDRGTPAQRPVNFIRKIKNNKAVKNAIPDTLEREWEKMFK